MMKNTSTVSGNKHVSRKSAELTGFPPRPERHCETPKVGKEEEQGEQIVDSLEVRIVLPRRSAGDDDLPAIESLLTRWIARAYEREQAMRSESA